jgi:tRNA A37 threonylcarbamoyltransferase TsaD
MMARRLGPRGKGLRHASPRLAVDNGAMVARAAHFRFHRGDLAVPELTADSALAFPGLEVA